MLPIPSNAKYFQVITLGDILDYAEECYNDSTEVIFGYFMDFYDGEFKAVYKHRPGAIVGNLIRTEKGHTHTAPTFEGFSEWFKNRSSK